MRKTNINIFLISMLSMLMIMFTGLSIASADCTYNSSQVRHVTTETYNDLSEIVVFSENLPQGDDPGFIMQLPDGFKFGISSFGSQAVPLNDGQFFLDISDNLLHEKQSGVEITLIYIPGTNSALIEVGNHTGTVIPELEFWIDMNKVYVPADAPQVIRASFFANPGSSFVDSDTIVARSDEPFTYIVTNDEVLITGYRFGNVANQLIIPDRIQGLSVTGIGDYAFSNGMVLGSILFPDSLRSIGEGAFQDCFRMDLYGRPNIEIPQGTTNIGANAFAGCTALNSITFNSALTEIYDDANTIPNQAKIIGYDPSTAKTYAEKYGRTFEAIAASQPALQTATPIINGTVDALDTEIRGTTVPGATVVLFINGKILNYLTTLNGVWEFDSLTLAAGDRITVTAQRPGEIRSEAGETTVAEAETATSLIGLSVKEGSDETGKELITGFDSNNPIYSLQVPNEVENVNISVTNAANTSYIIYLNNIKQTSNVLNLAEGSNQIIIAVNEADKKSSSYNLTITRGNIDQCFIATAAYGSKYDWPVAMLRKFRDQYLLTNNLGRAFVEFYYHHSPPLAAAIASKQPLKILVRVLLTPIVAGVYAIYHPMLIPLVFVIFLLPFIALTKFKKRTI